MISATRFVIIDLKLQNSFCEFAMLRDVHPFQENLHKLAPGHRVNEFLATSRVFVILETLRSFCGGPSGRERIVNYFTLITHDFGNLIREVPDRDVLPVPILRNPGSE